MAEQAGPNISGKFILSPRGNMLIAVGEFIFRKTKLSKGVSYWICTHYDKTKCRCSLKVINGSDPPCIIQQSQEHNHCASFGTVEAKEVVQRMKIRSSQTNEPPSQIYASTMASAKLSPLGAIAMGRKDTIKRTINRTRNKNNQVPSLPKSIQELEIGPLITDGGVNLMLYDSGRSDTNRRYVVFSNEELLDNMEKYTEWHADGTFKTVPNLFCQMYTIHFTKGRETFPGVYALLTHKDVNMYKDLLQVLKQKRPSLQPTTLMHDFELAAIRAFSDEFPNVEITGCLFHLSQSIQRKVQELGLKTQYISDRDFSIQVKSLTALAFVPESDVERCFRILTSSANGWPSIADDLANYFRDTYIGSTNHQQGSVRRALFPPSVWNVRRRTIDEMHRTNNSIEGWHRGFGILVGGCHVNIWSFLECIKKDVIQKKVDLIQIFSGQGPQTRKKKYVTLSENLKRLCEETWNGTMPTIFLERVTYNLN